jgi:hypothetical protein
MSDKVLHCLSMADNDARVTLRLPADLLARLDAESRRLNRSHAWVIRSMLIDSLTLMVERGEAPTEMVPEFREMVADAIAEEIAEETGDGSSPTPPKPTEPELRRVRIRSAKYGYSVMDAATSEVLVTKMRQPDAEAWAVDNGCEIVP